MICMVTFSSITFAFFRTNVSFKFHEKLLAVQGNEGNIGLITLQGIIVLVAYVKCVCLSFSLNQSMIEQCRCFVEQTALINGDINK